jgi:hypothetical protein
MQKIAYRPEERTPFFASVYDHDEGRFPLHARLPEEIVMAAQGLRYWAAFLAASDKASLEAAADSVAQDLIHVREDVVMASLAIGLPVGGELTTPGLGIPI